MFTNFDCSAYFVKDESALVRTFEILPEYLKTREGDRVKNYRDWGIQLGRRFRALKLWFVIRTYGVNGIRERIKKHLELGKWFKDCIENSDNFELLAPVPLNLVCFRYHPSDINDEAVLNRVNEQLMNNINDTGKMYLTHTTLNGKFTLRMVMAQTFVEHRHVENAWALIREKSAEL
jgi:aromatic-L-amino-acid decarboxylase